MTTTSDTRTMSIVDLPLIRRLTGTGTILDSELGLTRDLRSPNSLQLSNMLFSRGMYTLITRSDTQPVVGQFRYRPDDLIAQLVYLAPALEEHSDNTLWLHLLDAMAREAGKHGAHSLVAEVETNSHLFETMRSANFATYARQVIWRHEAMPNKSDSLYLEAENNQDQIGIMALIAHIVPTMLQTIAAPHSEMEGLVYRKGGRIEAYIGLSEGKQGIYLVPYLHTDVMDEAADILSAAIASIERSSKVPVFVCVRNYHYWLNSVMEKLGFEAWLEQAVMVKQLVAGIRHPSFTRINLHGKLELSPCIYRLQVPDEYSHEEIS